MERSLAELQLQVTQLASDPMSPVKNEPVHGSNAKCVYNEYSSKHETYVCACACKMQDGDLCICTT